MAKEVYYFRHDANSHTDLKIKSLRKKFGWKGYGWWWYLIEILRSEDDYELEYSDNNFEGLSEDMGCDIGEVKEFIDCCINKGLLKTENGYLYAPRLSRDMDVYRELSEKARSAAYKRWGKDAGLDDDISDSNASAVRTHSEPNTIKLNETKLKKNKEKEKKEENDLQVVDEKAVEIWNKALKEIQPQVSKKGFSTFFSETTGESYKNGNFLIGVTSEYKRQYLEKNQLSKITQAVENVAGEKTEVMLVLRNNRGSPGGN